MKRAGTIAAWTKLDNTIREYCSRAFAGPKELILVAESNQALRKGLMNVLREQHYRTIEACDGAEAVRIGVRCRQIHLLVTGLRLPDLIGWELEELLRLDHPALAVVYVGHNLEDWRRLSSKRFKSRFLQVPFPPEAALEVVRWGLHTHRELDSRLRLLGMLPDPRSALWRRMAALMPDLLNSPAIKGFIKMAGLGKFRSARGGVSSTGTGMATPLSPGKPGYGPLRRGEIRRFARRLS
jgi:CheY-like chemotaxis protein